MKTASSPTGIGNPAFPAGFNLRPFAVGLALALGLVVPAQAQLEFAFYQRPGSVYEMHVPENSLHAEIAVSLRGSPNDTGVEASVDYSTADATAVSGEDFTAVSGTLHFAAGERFQWISVPILNDGRSEPEEHFVVVLKNPTGGASLGDPAEVGVYITDNDPGLSFTSSTYSASEDQGTVTLTVRRMNLPDPPYAVNCAVAGGTATAGEDFEVVSATPDFAAGEISKSIVITLLNDGVWEAEGTIAVTLKNPAGGAIVGDPTTAMSVKRRVHGPTLSAIVAIATGTANRVHESKEFVPNTITAANAGGPLQLPMRTRWAARAAQLCR